MRAEQIVSGDDQSGATTPETAIGVLPGRPEIADVDRRVRGFVAERPLLAVGLALAAGYVVGRVIARVS